MNEIIQKPVLVESGTRYFLGSILKNCKEFKNKYYDSLFNIFLLTAFLLILGIILLL